MAEYISRESAIKELNVEGYTKNMRIHKRILAIPAADVAPVRHGRWIVIAEFTDCVYARCDQCKITQVFYHNKPLTDYCPACGADMRDERDNG